jgi:hypothetical protein
MNYLQIREDYKLAYHRWEACAHRLCELFRCDFATLEEELLGAMTTRKHQALIQQYARLGIELDKASDRWDTAQLLQARNTAAANAMRRDLQLLDC